MKNGISSTEIGKYLISILRLLSVISVSLFLVLPAWSQEPLILGVHPFLPFKTIEKKFSPLAEYLGRKSGRPLLLRVGSSYQEHIDAIGRDQLDIAYIGPAEYVNMVATFGQKPLLARQETEGSPFFTGIIVVRSELQAQTLDQLPLGDFAFVNSHSTMGYLIPRIMLLKDNPVFIRAHHYQFLGTHENVALGVLAGDFIAGAVKRAVYEKFKKRGLKALAVTPLISEHLLLTRSDLDSVLVEKLRRALLALKNDPANAAVLSALKPSLTGFVEVQDQDYNSLRMLLADFPSRGEKR